MSNDTLTHYGILGMKWGVRRTKAQLDRARRAGSEAKTAKKLATAYTNAIDKRAAKKPSSVTRANEAKTAHKLADAYVNAMNKKATKARTKARTKATTLDKKTNPVKNMSDDELRRVVNRLQMERQYSQLSERSVGKGKEYAQKIIKAGTTVAAVTTTALTLYNNAEKIKKIISKG